MISIQNLIYTVPAALIAISFHEYAHGFVSEKLGDPTPRSTGRMSINPLAHLDLVGTLCLIFFHFGWAKPVMVNPNYYKDRKKGMILVGLAGPCMNFILAVICAIAMKVILIATGGYAGSFVKGIFTFFKTAYTMNIGLGVFNLIPFPPLDGAKIFGGLLPDNIYFGLMKYERYGQIILFALLWIGAIDKPLGFMFNIVNTAIWGIINFAI